MGNEQKLVQKETEIDNLKNTIKRLRTKNSISSSKVTYLERELKHARQNKSLDVINEGVPIKEDEKMTKDVHVEKELPDETEVGGIGEWENDKSETQKAHETNESDSSNEEETPEGFELVKMPI